MTGDALQRSTPRRIEVVPGGGSVRIAWSDGHESVLDALPLRRACPCATCQDERSHGGASATQGKSGSERKPSALRFAVGPALAEVSIAKLVPVGRYAVQFEWRDGHDTGIYSFELLRSLCPCAICRGEVATDRA